MMSGIYDLMHYTYNLPPTYLFIPLVFAAQNFASRVLENSSRGRLEDVRYIPTSLHCGDRAALCRLGEEMRPLFT